MNPPDLCFFLLIFRSFKTNCWNWALEMLFFEAVDDELRVDFVGSYTQLTEQGRFAPGAPRKETKAPEEEDEETDVTTMEQPVQKKKKLQVRASGVERV